jgi:hypothetical protein
MTFPNNSAEKKEEKLWKGFQKDLIIYPEILHRIWWMQKPANRHDFANL